jgi:hypothetical protein
MNAIEHTEVRSIAFVLSVCVSSGLCVRTYRVRSNVKGAFERMRVGVCV